MNAVTRFSSLLWAGMVTPYLMSYRHSSLLQMLLQREFINRSSGTVLGKLWPLLQPALQVAGFWFLFDIVYNMRANQGASFVEYLLSGMLPWLCVSEVLNRSVGMFREFGSLYRRTPFPVEILPVVIMAIPTGVFMLVYAAVCLLLYGPLSALLSLLVIPLIMLWLMPVVLLFSVLGLFIRDFAQALPFVLMLTMYATPILYFPDMLPDSVQQFLWLNPFADILESVHAFVEHGEIHKMPLARLTLEWLVLLAPTWLIFRRSLPHIREVL